MMGGGGGGGGGGNVTTPYSLLRLVEALLLSRLLSSSAHMKEDGLVGGNGVTISDFGWKTFHTAGFE